MINLKYIFTFLLGGALFVSSCIKDDDSPGYEYMPDMYRSQAIEAYVDYGMVKDDEKSEAAMKRKNTISARKPAMGSIPFKKSSDDASIFMPYKYADTEEGYESSKENKIPSLFLSDVDGNVDEGKRLYNIMCQHCHGKKGLGNGLVVTKFGFNPPNAYNAGLKDRSLGTIFHVITYGKNAMGPHASQLNKEERWKVAMYVRTLQHDGDFKLEELTGSVPEIDFSSVSEEDVANMKAGSKITLRNVHFKVGSSELSDDSKQELEKLAHLMNEHPEMKIEVAGHTDNTGNETNNVSLSKKRALSVLKDMEAHGIDAVRLQANGYGSSVPVADNSTDEGKQANRRIEFEILEK